MSEENENQIVEVTLKAQEILRTPLLNKGTGFTDEERSELDLHGLLPSHVSTIEEQTERRYANFKSKPTDIEKYVYLTALQDRNEVLFYRVALEHCEEMLPFIYTPTVGDASLDYSNLYSQNRGIYISYPLKDKMEEMIQNIPRSDVDVIVVTDGSRILGLGDVGIGGMTIPVGKLSLYTLFGGIHPGRTLPILLDLGTNSQELLDNPLYLGWQQPRIEGQEYDEFLDAFVKAIKKRFPNVLLQWEDFSKPNAQNLLERYQNKICSFNDDIQGTASVALAAILAALNAKNETLQDQRIVIAGGGGAGLGIAKILLEYMVFHGLSKEEALKRFYIVDRFGLIYDDLHSVDPLQKAYSKSMGEVANWIDDKSKEIPLEKVIEETKPSILIGVSAQKGIFTQSIVQTMARSCEKPIIFPLSNPTSKSEASPKDLIDWTDGKALVATGSPPSIIEHKNKLIHIAQCNNVYIFPGVGLGAIATKAKSIPDEMFLKAAEVLASFAPILQDSRGSLFPRINTLREVSRKIGIEVAKYAIENGLNQVETDNIEELIDQTIWYPKYSQIKKLTS